MKFSKTQIFLLSIAQKNSNGLVTVTTGKQSCRLPKSFGNRRIAAAIDLRNRKLLRVISIEQFQEKGIYFNRVVYRLTALGAQTKT